MPLYWRMAKNALLLHGTDHSPESNWLPWLDVQLTANGYEVERPQLPSANAPDMDRYWDALRDYPFDGGTVIIGHSSGAVAALRLLERIEPVVRGVISVAGFYRDDGFGCKAMFKTEPDWERIRSHAGEIQLWWAPDDKYIEKEQTDFLSKKLLVNAACLSGRKRSLRPHD